MPNTKNRVRNYWISDEKKALTKNAVLKLPPPERPLRIGTSGRLFSKTSEVLLARLWKQDLNEELLQQLYSAVLNADHVRSVSDIRGPHQMITLGYWTERGHSNIHSTPQSQGDFAPTFINQFRALWTHTAARIQEEDPDYVANIRAKVPQDLRLFGDLFSTLFINVTCGTKVHRDSKDYGYCVVIPLGEFSGGDLLLRASEVRFILQPGDFLMFKSSQLYHEVTDFDGLRSSLVLTTHTHLLTIANNCHLNKL